MAIIMTISMVAKYLPGQALTPPPNPLNAARIGFLRCHESSRMKVPRAFSPRSGIQMHLTTWYDEIRAFFSAGIDLPALQLPGQSERQDPRNENAPSRTQPQIKQMFRQFGRDRSSMC